jgi:hypothetical protein
MADFLLAVCPGLPRPIRYLQACAKIPYSSQDIGNPVVRWLDVSPEISDPGYASFICSDDGQSRSAVVERGHCFR